MRVVIVGYGRIGIRTARVLAEEGHDVVIVDDDIEKINRAKQEGFTVVQGSGDRPETLMQANLETADALAAVTGDIAVNQAACAVGKRYDLRTVLRVDADYPPEEYRAYAEAADAVIYPEQLGAAAAKTALLGGDVSVLAELTDNLQLSVIQLPQESPAVGEYLSQLSLPDGVQVYAHSHGDASMTIPVPSVQLQAGDRLALIIEHEAAAQTKDYLLGR